MIALLLGLATAAACERTPGQDLNCNGVLVEDEPLVSLDDPQCAAIVAARGPAYESADYYYDQGSFGCQYLVDGFDPDGDGLSAGLITFFNPETGLPDLVVILSCDSCPTDANPEQADLDCDDVGDVCDNCVSFDNTDQENADGDAFGDACDHCPALYSVDNDDVDGDRIGDACDICPDEADPDQADLDDDGHGDACDVCPSVFDILQTDRDGDGLGDACDRCPDEPLNAELIDEDEDQIGDGCDNCPRVANIDQSDSDEDGIGDACDTCVGPDDEDEDRDGAPDACDNCPGVLNVSQADSDRDGLGDDCDPYSLRGGACATGPGAAGSVGALLLALVIGRGRRYGARGRRT